MTFMGVSRVLVGRFGCSFVGWGVVRVGVVV